MRRLVVAAVAASFMAAPLVVNTTGAGAEGIQTDTDQQFVVLYADGASDAAARAAIATAGGTIVSENTDVGVATVETANASFEATADASPAIAGTAANRFIGSVPHLVRTDGSAKKLDPAEAEVGLTAPSANQARGGGANAAAEPLADLQWDMQQIGATASGSYRYEQGKGVKVGIIDTGVDASHPDIAPN